MNKQAKVIAAVAVVAVATLVFPLSNLVSPKRVDPVLMSRVQDTKFMEAASAYASCADCHTSKPRMPFYASLPGARGMIESDRAAAVQRFDMEEEYFSGRPVSEVALAKVQRAIERGTMPPARYTALHWGARPEGNALEAHKRWTRYARAKANGLPDDGSSRLDGTVFAIDAATGLNPAKVALGRTLFHDTRLSKGDELSCASCHDLKKGGTDQQSVSDGVRGQKGPINSPTVYNARYALAQFWDGRAKDLQEQANGPVNNPLEMGSNWEEALGKLRADGAFVAEFARAYPDGLSGQSVTDAIAEFEKSLVTPGARFDRYLGGDESALTDDERRGFVLFRSNGCDTCHVGRALGQRSFEHFGRYSEGCASKGAEQPVDLGRYNVTKAEGDRHHFKVPTLRNVAITFPYFHHGSTSDLTEAVKLMGRCQLPVPLSDQDAGDIAKFLRTLTGTFEGKAL